MTISVTPRITGIGSASLGAPINAAVAAAIARTIDIVTQGGAPAALGLPRPPRGPDPAPFEPPVIATTTLRA